MSEVDDILASLFSPQAGQARRQWLDAQTNALMYYVPPEIRPQLNALASMTPAAAYGDSVAASRRMLADGATPYQRGQAAGDMAAGVLGIVAPGYIAGKAGAPIANALGEVMMGYSAPARNALTEFGAAEDGGVSMGRGASRRYIDNLDDLYAEWRASRQPMFVRWSAGPKYDLVAGARSKDYASGQMHAGLSAVDLPISENDLDLSWEPQKFYVDRGVLSAIRDYSYLRGGGYKNNEPHIYEGRVVGSDSDGAPSIAPTRYVGTVSKRIVDLIDNADIVDRLALEADYAATKARAEAPVKEGMIMPRSLVDYEAIKRALELKGGSAYGLLRATQAGPATPPRADIGATGRW